MKQQLIENIKALASNRKECLYLSMRVDIPGKVILNMGKYINQDEMQDLLEEFGNHAGLSYRISIDTTSQFPSIAIEIFVKCNKAVTA